MVLCVHVHVYRNVKQTKCSSKACLVPQGSIESLMYVSEVLQSLIAVNRLMYIADCVVGKWHEM